MDLNLSNPDFCRFLLAQFSFAADNVKEMTLLDYLDAQGAMPDGVWLEALTGADGSTYVATLNDTTTFYAQFRPHGTVYFFNETYLGQSGGHAHLSLLSWSELKAILAGHDNPALFLLLLPLVIGREEERDAIRAAILKVLGAMALTLDSEALARFLLGHIIFADAAQNMVLLDAEGEVTTPRAHSERSVGADKESLHAVNAIIRQAMQQSA